MARDKEIVTIEEKKQTNDENKTKKKSFVRAKATVSPTQRNHFSGKSSNKNIIIDSSGYNEDSQEGEEESSNEEVYRDFEPEVLGEEGESLPALTSEEEQFEDEEGPDDADLDVIESGLVTTSALQRYLAEVRKYSMMTREEEREVATQAYEQNDITAKNKLVTANLRLVVKIAMEYRRAYTQILDLIQEGNAGLVQAVNRFNPYRGVKLSTYSAWWIRAYILKFLMDNKSLVRMGTTDAQRKLFFRLRGEAEKLYALTQKFDANLLAERIGVQAQDVVDMQQRLTKNDVSLDTPVGEDGDTRQMDLLYSDNESADTYFEREQLLKILRKEVAVIEKDLNERDAYIFHNRIMSENPITLQDVGDKYGITRERARQLEARVIKKIKDRIIATGITK